MIGNNDLPFGNQSGRSLGILDSGVGGLSALREVYLQMPWVDVTYIGDTANVPYGDKPIAIVRDLAIRLSAQLIDEGASAVLMASGTSTVAGLDAARDIFPDTPIFGVIEPGARAAVARTSGTIGVVSTNATAHSLAFTHSIRQFDPNREVVEIGCPRFVPLVESGMSDSDEAVDACREYLEPLVEANVSAVVFGCTHFPFLIRAMERALDDLNALAHPVFVDPAAEAVADIRRLWRAEVSGPEYNGERGITRFAATGDPEQFAENASKLLGEPVTGVRKLELKSVSYV